MVVKVGIITFHCSYNFGSALQALALQEAIRGLGHDAYIVDYRSKNFNQYHLFRLSRPWTIPRSIFRIKPLLLRRESFRAFWKERFLLTEKTYSYRNEAQLNELTDEFDAFVCGSDQIWNLDCTNGIVEPFFLSFAGCKKRIAYAPSLAHTSFDESLFDRRRVSELLSRFDSLSIREEETLQLFQPLVEKRIEVVVDPTLLNSFTVYQELASPRLIERPYVFVYLLRECSELVKTARCLARHGAYVVYISPSDLAIPNSSNLFGVGPKEFLSLILHADLVLANSFHATVFSVLFHKQFRTFAVDKSASRMRDFLISLCIEDCCVTEACPGLESDVDWGAVDSKLSNISKESLRYLKKALDS